MLIFFFNDYQLNLWKECPFWPDDGLCMNRDCSVETIDEVRIISTSYIMPFKYTNVYRMMTDRNF